MNAPQCSYGEKKQSVQHQKIIIKFGSRPNSNMITTGMQAQNLTFMGDHLDQNNTYKNTLSG